MTPTRQTNTARHAAFGNTADHLTAACPSTCPQASQQQPLITVMCFPDGSEILLRATKTGWIVTDNGIRSRQSTLAARQDDRDAVKDIAATYAFAASCPVAAPVTRYGSWGGATPSTRPLVSLH